MLAAERPDLLVSAGFGGGVLPGLGVGDVVMAERLLHWTGNGFEQVEARFYGQDTGINPLAALRGEFITSDGILNKKQLVAILPRDATRPVVEMESAAVARVAAERGIPFMGLRAISDPWDEELAFSIDEFCDDDKRIRPHKVFATILRRPRIIPQLFRLAWNSHIAARSLGKAMERLLEQM
jgi:adenosylhomocysteine nucleosidase